LILTGGEGRSDRCFGFFVDQAFVLPNRFERFRKLYRSDFWVGSFGGLIKAIDDFANFTGCKSGFVGFRIEGDKQNADFVS